MYLEARKLQSTRRCLSRHNNLRDVWCTMDGLKLMLKQCGDAMTQEQFITGRHTTTTLHWCYAFVQMELSLLLLAVFLVWFMTAKLPIKEIFMINLSLSLIGMAQNVLSIKLSQELIHNENYKERNVAQDATSMRQSAEWWL
jgi:hypothetical protein